MKQTPLLGVYGVTYKIPHKASSMGKRQMIVNEVSFELNRGEIVALLGPNGSGKSTLMKLVSGIIPLRGPGCSGLVRYLGQEFLSLSSCDRAQRIVYVPPDTTLEFPLTVEESVSLGFTAQKSGFGRMASKEDREKIRWAMSLCLCEPFKDRELDTLSGGEQQLVALARALVQGAKILFLDETLSRMDLNHQHAMGTLLKNLARQGWTILLVSHDLNLASEWADRILLLKEGQKIFFGSMQEAMTADYMKILYPQTQLVVGANPVTGSPKIFFGRSQK